MPGAYARSSDIGFGQPRLAEQDDVAFLKINMGTRGIHGLTREGIGETGSVHAGAETMRDEQCGKLGRDLETAAAYGRPEKCQHILHVCSKTGHHTECLPHNTCKSALPSRVDNGNDIRPGSIEDDRDTIGSAHTYPHTFEASHDGIGLRK